MTITKNTTKKEIIDYMKKEDLDLLTIIELVDEAQANGIDLTIDECFEN
jgi:hypothetical protein